MRFESRQSLSCCVRTIAFVAIAKKLLPAGYLSRLLVDDSSRDPHRGQFTGKESLRLRPRSSLLTEQGILILNLAADLVTLRHDLCRVAHNHVYSGLMLLNPGIGITVARSKG